MIALTLAPHTKLCLLSSVRCCRDHAAMTTVTNYTDCARASNPSALHVPLEVVNSAHFGHMTSTKGFTVNKRSHEM